MAQKMEQQEIIARINALCKEAGITHNQLAAAVYEARNKKLHEIRDKYQDQAILIYFDDGLMVHQIKDRTVTEMIDIFPETLRGIIQDYEHKDGQLGMVLNNNIPSHWATFPMSEPRFIEPQKF